MLLWPGVEDQASILASKELDSTVFMSPFQLRLFYGGMLI